MSRFTKYAADPRWINVRFAGRCDKCKAEIPSGSRAFYYPNGRKLYGETCGCGETACADFEAAAEDEDFMTGGLNG